MKLPCLREAAPLLELDRDERKLEAFLQLHKHDLLVADLRIFLPFTINLDPYFRKVLKGKIELKPNANSQLTPSLCLAEDQQAMEDEGIIIPAKAMHPPSRSHSATIQPMMAQHYSTSFNTNPFHNQISYNASNNVPSYNNYNMANANSINSDAPQRKRSVVDGQFFEKTNDFINTFPVSVWLVPSATCSRLTFARAL